MSDAIEKLESLDNIEDVGFNEAATGQFVDVLQLDALPAVDSDLKAESYLRAVAIRRNEIKRIADLRDAEIAKIQDIFNNQIEKIERSCGFLEGYLENFLREINRQDSKVKSRKYSAGVLKLSKSPDKVEIVEGFTPTEADLDKPGINKVVKTEIKINKTEIKKYIKETGEVLDYAELVPGVTKFKVEVY